MHLSLSASAPLATTAPGPGLTPQQSRWAAQHDWYVSTTGEAFHGLTVTVDDGATIDGVWEASLLEFRDFSALRSWAGY
jgi:hypothetical protein